MDFNFTPEDIAHILHKLSAPFEKQDVKWRVTAISKDKKKGLAVPYATPRAYAARLNDVLTPAGWSCLYDTQTMTGLSRLVPGSTTPVSTGKVIAVATLEIYGISSKSSMGEMWADDNNATTRAEAQALKRAAAMFGLGKYFYDLQEAGLDFWVAVDEFKQPLKVPELPAWATPEGHSQAQQRGTQQLRQGTGGTSQAPATTVQAVSQTAPQREFEEEKSALTRSLGQPLFASIVSAVNRMAEAGQVKGDKYTFMLRVLRERVSLLEKVRTAASEMSVSYLASILDRLEVSQLDLIPNYQTLAELARQLDVEAQPVPQAA